jgi:hypothetical protein
MVCCGKHIIQEGPPFVPPQGDRIKGMGGSGLGKCWRKALIELFSSHYQRILKMVTKTEKNSPFLGQFH